MIMSRKKTESVICPSCHKNFDVEFWQSLNRDLDSQAKDQLLDGTLFDVDCPHFQFKSRLVYSILYHDMTNKVMVQLNPDVNGSRTVDEFMKEETVEKQFKLMDYRRRQVKNEFHLREKAIIFSLGLDDRIIEIEKLVYAQMMEKREPDSKFTDMLFLENGDHWYFAIINDGEQVAALQIDKDFYKKLAKEYQPLFSPEQGWIIVDHDWALDFLESIEQSD
jgi:hypothetical protein